MGANTADDAGVYQIDRHRALVQTVDFFTPIVDDPFLYGQIAAANALSDVFAMGGRPLTALNVLGVPTEIISTKTIQAILRGGAAKVKEAGCVLVGGHSISNPEPIYGLAVTGIVSPRRMITNAAARPGDVLILTKPLGTGIITTGIKRNLTSAATAKKAIRMMSQLNTAGAELGERGLVKAGTDVTGYSLLGHLASMCRASGVGAEIFADNLPAIDPEVFRLIERDCIPGGTRQNLEAANELTTWHGVGKAQQILATDAQTSGGMLLCVAPKRVEAVLEVLKKHRTACRVEVGRIVSSRTPKIEVFSH